MARTAKRFLRVKNWDTLQHYKDGRRLPWIKLYDKLLEDYELSKLTEVQQLHLVKIWLLANRKGNKIPDDHGWVRVAIGARRRVELNVLRRAGFLETWRPATKTPANDQAGNREAVESSDSNPPLEAEVEVEVDKGSSIARGVLPFEKQQKIDKLLRWCGDHADSRTEGQFSTVALGIPEGSLAKVLESCLQARDVRNRAGYALNALKSEAAERAA